MRSGSTPILVHLLSAVRTSVHERRDKKQRVPFLQFTQDVDQQFNRFVHMSTKTAGSGIRLCRMRRCMLLYFLTSNWIKNSDVLVAIFTAFAIHTYDWASILKNRILKILRFLFSAQFSLLNDGF